MDRTAEQICNRFCSLVVSSLRMGLGVLALMEVSHRRLLAHQDKALHMGGCVNPMVKWSSVNNPSDVTAGPQGGGLCCHRLS